MVKKISLTKKQFQNPCADCGGTAGALCCVALSIETPRQNKRQIDVDCVYWYLTRSSFYVTTVLKNGKPSLHPNRWEITVSDRCEHLGKNNRCKIYDTRPVTCSDYSPFPLENPGDNVNTSGYCDRYEPGTEKIIFRRSKEFYDFILQNFPKAGNWLEKRQTLKYDRSKLNLIT
ncbi:MAG: YkgJ family cysteine cluster protein [Nitrospinota bacterium]